MRNLITLLSVILVASALACSSSIDIENAHCQQDDLPGYTLNSTELWTPDEWDAKEAISTEWSGSGYRVRCLTLIYESVEDARWALNYSTALQRVGLLGGALRHQQITAPNIGDDSLAFEVVSGRFISSLQIDTVEAVATTVMIRRGTVVVMVEFGCCPEISRILGRYYPQPSVDEPAKVANSVDQRIHFN